VATLAELQRERKTSLREVRRRERALDTELERMERRIFRLLDRKTLITTDDSIGLADRVNSLGRLLRDLEVGVADFVEVSSTTGYTG